MLQLKKGEEMKKFLQDDFIKFLLKQAAGYEITENTLKIFYIKNELNENLVKNRLSLPYKEIKIKNNSIFIKF